MHNVYNIPRLWVRIEDPPYAVCEIDSSITDPYSALALLRDIRAEGFRVALQCGPLVILEMV